VLTDTGTYWIIRDSDIDFTGALHRREVLREVSADPADEYLDRLQPTFFDYGRLRPMLIQSLLVPTDVHSQLLDSLSSRLKVVDYLQLPKPTTCLKTAMQFHPNRPCT